MKSIASVKMILVAGMLAGLPLLAQNSSNPTSRGAVISGRVVDVNGNPVPGFIISTFPAQYYYIPVDYPEGRYRLSHLSPVGAGTIVKTASTNTNGEYRFEIRPAGEYFLCGQKGSDDKAFCGLETFGAQYYPGTSDISKARTIHLHAGVDMPRADWVLPLERPRGVDISGSIVDSEGGPRFPYRPMFVLVPHTPYAEPLNGRGVLVLGNALPAGGYLLRNIPPGSYDLVVRGQGEVWGARMLIEVGAQNIENLDIVLRPDPDVKLQGRLIVKGAPNERVFPFDKLEVRVFGDVYFWKGGQTIKVDASGNIGFDYVPPDGNYALRIGDLPSDAYVEDIRQGGKSIYDGARFGDYGIKMTSNPGIIEVIVGVNGGTIEGIAEDAQGKPAANATVTLAPEASRRQNPYLFQTVDADEQGHFTMTGVGPGDYKVFAWENIPPYAYENPAYLAPHERESVTVTMSAAGHSGNLRVRTIESD